MLSVILTSCPPAAAQGISDALIHSRTAACVSAIPGVLSTYRWQGQIQRDPETLLVIKTTRDQVEACMAALREVHPYTVPEMVELPADRVWEAYLDWATAETRLPN
ncbi:MAG: divalent-cation tolerance protein CutA [Deltaproteobacteria bacterium]|nr:divalent-cation tolerance protein CutA [Deltaproteobacteria bacterium]